MLLYNNALPMLCNLVIEASLANGRPSPRVPLEELRRSGVHDAQHEFHHGPRDHLPRLDAASGAEGGGRDRAGDREDGIKGFVLHFTSGFNLLDFTRFIFVGVAIWLRFKMTQSAARDFAIGAQTFVDTEEVASLAGTYDLVDRRHHALVALLDGSVL